eukprot:gnl/TRDRNA2_/TRDRNA2_42929_c0_seq1.p1 gnl/TRDRNA2_/TRDRNA2_42929_c0~~gnl/TRDRNA2_/TRDRNA2_42929_c0_seq1.p1  ORF type:complete len:673 (-),score=114.85 gnl/TRDRNA2_/TRDRNA2_42929_c0_seq1:123-2117(-)
MSSDPRVDAARRVCQSLELPKDLEALVLEAFCDKGGLTAGDDDKSSDESAGPTAALIKASRFVLEKAEPTATSQEGMDEYALCEFLNALWQDDAWRDACKKIGNAQELEKRCPLNKILSGAKYSLHFGKKDASHLDFYFKDFSKLFCHEGMMSDETRTSAYHRAILGNRPDFEGKVVMDVGSGSGILAFFCVQAGAARVYCVEASQMVKTIERLAKANGWEDKIVIVNKILQDIRDEVPEKVDVIVSETLGNFLYAERGLETVCVARERFLKPDGKLFPTKCTFCLAPFSDPITYKSRDTQVKNFWLDKNFYGVDMSSCAADARNEVFQKPLCDQFHPDQLKAEPIMEVFDFETARSEDLAEMTFPFDFTAKETCLIHGIAGWFEAQFKGSVCDVVLSTSPWDTVTHWWQTRLMLPKPLAVNENQSISGSLKFAATKRQSYLCTLVMEANGVQRIWDDLDLYALDIGHRHYEYRIIEPTKPGGAALQAVDYQKTRPKPQFKEALVEDPCKSMKQAALRSQEARGASGPEDRTWGSQIMVRDVFYVLANEPATLRQWTQPGATLVQHGKDEQSGSIWLTPAENKYSLMIEHVPTAGGDMLKRIWLERKSYMMHMQKYIMGSPNRNKSVSDAEILGLDVEPLCKAYDSIRASHGTLPGEPQPASAG